MRCDDRQHMAGRPDLLLINPGDRRRMYQSLGADAVAARVSQHAGATPPRRVLAESTS
jgi:hypothetical protein